MSSLTKTPAQESASADSATPVPVSAGTTTSVPAQASISTREFTLSVGEYHALQCKKRVEDKAAAPEAILEGSSVWNTDGSMSTDYGSDISDVPMEDGEVRSQQPTPSRPQSRMSRSQGRVDPVKMIRALQVLSTLVAKKKRRHQHRRRLITRVLLLEYALRGCQAHPRLLPGSVRLRHRTRSRYTCAAPSLMTLRLQLSTLIR
ncbi:hypothetical protein PC116_g31076 [Phytophthora cactorum]|uniref:Uncharacterized protein n=1 Tax=Phytophthora cactorum TaxID=29920 RepID=A0A8T1ECP8_9STRA|nr:hypothetical protein Pcac1_g20583 [Phytophthora cactorum]KAG2799033.1 hypothetical protein PC111_g20597 [Phytophthora cactorum]KAG2883257.1 hypothetical protein PC114_g20665 [Phytophthora cactorum]KAG2896270.1 hypothetical protein PC117_g23051 [Phytophthora cactorum]KAG2951007.1 hypothetical protein PC118_g25213 [Phytophthora cactorum]